jgi:hypothetical protein
LFWEWREEKEEETLKIFEIFVSNEREVAKKIMYW